VTTPDRRPPDDAPAPAERSAEALAVPDYTVAFSPRQLAGGFAIIAAILLLVFRRRRRKG
jgi:hypothetical protein